MMTAMVMMIALPIALRASSVRIALLPLLEIGRLVARLLLLLGRTFPGFVGLGMRTPVGSLPVIVLRGFFAHGIFSLQRKSAVQASVPQQEWLPGSHGNISKIGPLPDRPTREKGFLS